MNSSNTNIKKLINGITHINFIIFMLFVENTLIYISYRNLFNYERCTNIIQRELHLFSQFQTFTYPEMCDESYYFHGFQWVHHIYQNGYVYQDRPMYLLLGFVLYRSIFALKTFFGFSFEPISLLLFSTLIYQIIIINLASYTLVKIFNKKFERIYFLLYFIIIFCSFEIRRYLFLPSSSNFYFLIFIFSLYSINSKKLNGFIYGCLITISGYGIIGYIYQLIPKLFNLRTNIKDILINTVFLFIPTILFEFLRIFMGIFKGPGYGVRYIYNAEFYQQFVWIFKSLFSENYIPATSCQEVSKFIGCYLLETEYFLKIMLFPIILCLIFMIIHKYKYEFTMNLELKNLILFSIFSYFFILFQGIYSFRIIYYSLGFFFLIYLCYFFKSIENPVAGLLFSILLGTYNLSRKSWEEFNLNFNYFELFLMFLIILLIVTNKKNIKLKKN
jgi:hypothetical protein